MKKRSYIILGVILVVLTLYGVISYFSIYDYDELSSDHYDYKYVDNYYEYQKFIDELEGINGRVTLNQALNEEDFGNGKKYLILGVYLESNEELSGVKFKKNKVYFYYETRLYKYNIGNYIDVYAFNVNKEYNDIKVYYQLLESNNNHIFEPQVKKPMIYIYPEEEMDLEIKLSDPSILTHTYPKYNTSWSVRVDKSGNIYDYNTNRNYYGLYWEAIDNYKLDMSEGFVVKGEDTTKFLEDKLSVLGLNEREINEFIVYWIDDMENNKYNFIRFRTSEEINEMMGLSFSKNPDTLIRVIMDYKALDKPIEVKEQELTSVTRKGLTIVEWGASKHN